MKFAVHESESLAFVRSLPDASVDCVVTDPPYGLGKEPDAVAMLRDWMTTGHHDHKGGGGFMGKKWDAFVPQPAFWAECLRVMKPGAHLVTFGGTRTFDLVTLGLRIAGFEVRDVLAWMYGSGFPKSLDVSKAIDKEAGAVREVLSERPAYGIGGNASFNGHADGAVARITAPATPAAQAWEGWGTALKPAWEPVVLARKPLAGTVAENVQRFGVGALNVDGCRIGEPSATFPKVRNARIFQTGAGGQEVSDNNLGRWPANVVLDEAAGAVLDEQSGELQSGDPCGIKAGGQLNTFGVFAGGIPVTGYGDAGGASRFFYCAKASRSEREAGLREAGLGVGALRDGERLETTGRNHHPTVKPIALMRWLVRLVTPPGGTVHDFFTGSGTTGCAAMLEGFDFTGCDREADYVEIARARIEFWRKASPSHVQAEFGEFSGVGK